MGGSKHGSRQELERGPETEGTEKMCKSFEEMVKEIIGKHGIKEEGGILGVAWRPGKMGGERSG